ALIGCGKLTACPAFEVGAWKRGGLRAPRTSKPALGMEYGQIAKRWSGWRGLAGALVVLSLWLLLPGAAPVHAAAPAGGVVADGHTALRPDGTARDQSYVEPRPVQINATEERLHGDKDPHGAAPAGARRLVVSRALLAARARGGPSSRLATGVPLLCRQAARIA